jgi:hypothetical protein
LTIKRKLKPDNQTKFGTINSKDLFDLKNNPTLRLDADFALELSKKLQKQNKKDILGDKID